MAVAHHPMSSFKPHHKVKVDYPSPNVLPANVIGILPHALDSYQRYEPRPLVHTRSVAIHSGREEIMANTFRSIYHATVRLPNGRQGPNIHVAGTQTPLILIDAVNHCVGFVGETLLQVATHFDVNGQFCIRVQRDTWFSQIGGGKHNDLATYLVDAVQMKNLNGKPQWLEDLLSLVYRDCDRAAQYVRLHVENNNFNGFDPGLLSRNGNGDLYWRPPRRPGLNAVLYDSAIMQPRYYADQEVQSAQAQFSVCFEDYLERPKSWIRLRCMHWLCQDDFSKHFDATQHCMGCPLCRRQVFNDDEKESLALSLVRGEYQYNAKLTRAENFERACADLDEELSENSNRLRRVNANFLEDFWVVLVDNWGDIDPSVGPRHLYPPAMPEYKVVKQAFTTAVRSMHGTTKSLSEMSQMIIGHIFREIFRRHERNGAASILSPAERAAVRERPEDNKLMRDGLAIFVRRSVNRILQSQHLRVCHGCGTNPPVDPPRLHYHGNAGGRLFYDFQAAYTGEYHEMLPGL